ncbi:hypothetical protein E3E23_04615 [Thermococcus sp. CX2]|uniref:hypothetical protein n=1 Tax=Thermococcus sp. CX2 TaxID=163006 RepID=UPI00143A1500|nr:hypothetical protein [Thermococcus sp. CX2]NJE85111.1 hypothetical protein [Thermococcus sp. CX2]
MADSSLVPLLVVLTPILLTVSFVAVMIKRYLDEYVPRKVVVRHENGKVALVIETKRGSTRIRVRDFSVRDCREVLEVRTNGLGFGRYRLGRYTGRYGEVISYAISDSGMLIEDTNGKRYYLAFDNIDEVVDAIMDDSIREKAIKVRDKAKENRD